ncbi:MAG: VTT domain-containing protein [Acidobacteriia bacterium]|nr:VTT domain-containing protein [Methyloceanibacter sp.]MCL6490376.1 VTT domain-containing protein [Terriglobia bacterium]
MSRQRLVGRLVLIVVIFAGVAWGVWHRELFEPAALNAWLRRLGIFAPAVFIALYGVGTVVFLPGWVFSLVGGALFGPLWGALIDLIGATLGATLAFLTARYLAGDWVAKKAPERLKPFFTGVEAEGWRFVALLRLIPLFPFNLTNYVLGLTKIGLVPYVVTSFICMAPGAIAYTWLGYSGREALAGNHAAIGYGLAALGLLAAIVLLPKLIGRIRSQKAPSRWVEPEVLRRAIQSTAPPIVLDVRGRDEFMGAFGYIPGALNIPLGELEARLGELRQHAASAIVTVCLTDKRSARARDILHSAGFAEVAVLRGGMQAWKALGFETARGYETVSY